MTLEEKKQRLIEDLSFIEDHFERLTYVIDCGKSQPDLDDSLKLDEFKVEGCVSSLWLIPAFKDGLCYFNSDADSAITKGIAAVLCDFYSGYAPEEILSTGPDFLGEVGITQHLSSNRRNGLSQLWKRISGFARACAEN